MEFRRWELSSYPILGKKGWFILSPDCDLPYETPKENMFALVEAGREHGKYKI